MSLSVELKVCEGCGCLFLRGDNSVRTCAGSTKVLAGFPSRRRERKFRRRGQTYGLVPVLPTVQAVAATAPSVPDAVEWRAAMPAAEPRPVWKRERPQNVAFYRKYTEALLRKFVTLSMQCGRSPALLGREVFGGDVSHCKVADFSESIAFCVDVERCCMKLETRQRDVLGRVAMQQYSQGEAAAMMGLSLSTTVKLYAGALDALTELLLQGGLMQPMYAFGEQVAA